MEKYKFEDEYKVKINDLSIREKIKSSNELYEDFKKKNIHKLDLENPVTIDKIYEKAEQEEIFEKAEEIKELVFGRDIHFYGVVYLWDKCINFCSYCPGSIPNRQEAIKKGKNYPLRELSVKQAIEETLAVMKDGHTHICYLAGSFPGREKLPEKLGFYLKEIDNLGLEEIILNVEPTTIEGFEKIRNSVKNTPIQYRIFQETYDKKTYSKVHPKGLKSDFNFRKNSQKRALDAGFDNIGLGVLFGLHQFPIEEIENLKLHSEELYSLYGKNPARICLPSANELKNIGVKIPYFIEKGEYRNGREEIVKKGNYEKFDELIYALTRLAMPTVNIVSSERDGPAMLKILDKYATCTTLNVHSGVGENSGIFNKNKETETVHFEQTTDFPRNPNKTVRDMKNRGYNPIINLN